MPCVCSYLLYVSMVWSSCSFLANVHFSLSFKMKSSFLFTCLSLFPIPASCIQVNSLSVCFASRSAQLSEWVEQPAGRLSKTPLLQEELSIPHRPVASSCSCSRPITAHQSNEDFWVLWFQARIWGETTYSINNKDWKFGATFVSIISRTFTY